VSGAPSVPGKNPPAAGSGAAAERAFHEESALGKAYDLSLLRKLLRFVRPYRWQAIVALVLLPIISELLVAQPRVLQYAIDRGIGRHDLSAVNRAAMIFAALLVSELTARFGQLYLTQYIGQRVMADVRRHTYEFLLRQRLAFFDRQPIGRLVTRVTNDIDAFGELFASGAVTAIGDLVTLVRIVIAMMLLSPRLSLFTFLAAPALVVLVEFFRRRARVAFRDIRAKTAHLNAFLSEQVQGITVVQAYGQQARCQREFDLINDEYRVANYMSIRYDALLFAVVEMFSAICIAVLLFIGARAIGHGAQAASVGTLVAFVLFVQRFFEPLRDISAKYTILQASMAGGERIFQLLASSEPDCEVRAIPPSNEAVVAAGGHAKIAFRHVTFGYGEERTVLRDVDFEIAPGTKVALVGATGAGKTTVLSLMQRLYDVDRGCIEIDGTDIRTLDREGLRRKFSVVPQDPYLFPGDVLSNIAVGADEPDRTRAERCARDVGLEDLLSRRGLGVDTPVEQRGANFSAGERQLIALARALYRDPEILLLDEATASVDSESETIVVSAVERALRGRTALIVAHRLSTIRDADLILVFHRGQLAERGTHEELVAQSGIYARLHRLQFGGQHASAA